MRKRKVQFNYSWADGWYIFEGLELVKAREKAGIKTQEEFARRGNWRQQYISRLETAQCARVKSQTLQAILEALSK